MRFSPPMTHSFWEMTQLNFYRLKQIFIKIKTLNINLKKLIFFKTDYFFFGFKFFFIKFFYKINLDTTNTLPKFPRLKDDEEKIIEKELISNNNQQQNYSTTTKNPTTLADKLSRSFFDLTHGSQERLQKWKNKLQQYGQKQLKDRVSNNNNNNKDETKYFLKYF